MIAMIEGRCRGCGGTFRLERGSADERRPDDPTTRSPDP
jgi:hypothetical protein